MSVKERETVLYYNVMVVNQEGDPIEGAKVTFVTNGTQYIETTSSNGKASHVVRYFIEEKDNQHNEDYVEEEEEQEIEIELCICGVSAVGYQTIEATPDKGVAVEPEPNQNLYTTIDLVPLENTYYYNISISDAVTKEPIQGVSVSIMNQHYSSPEKTLLTDKNGKCSFTYTDEGIDRFLSLEKNGYESIPTIIRYPDGTIGKIEENDNRFPIPASTSLNDITVVELKLASKVNYYYVIGVKNVSGNPVEGVKVRLYKNFAMTEPYEGEDISYQDAEDDIFYTICEIIASVISADASKIEIDDEFGRDLGIDGTELKQILSKVSSKFDVQLNTYEETNKVSELVDDIKQNQSKTLKRSIYTTNSNGLIQINIGENLSYQPTTIYAKGISLPVDGTSGNSVYIWGSVTSGAVPSTTENNIPGLTFTLSSYTASTYFYHFRIVDKQTEQPIKGADVIYTDVNDEILDSKVTPETGVVKYSSKSERLYLDVDKSGYKPIERTGYPGGTSNELIVDIFLNQKHTIQVIDNEGKPAQNIWVYIFVYDENGNKFITGKYKTYATGYIDNLGDEIYTKAMTTPTYVGVLGYDNAHEKSLIRQLINVTASIVIRLTKSNIEPDDVNEFEEFNEMSAYNIKRHIMSGNQNMSTNSYGIENQSQTDRRVSYNSDDFRINIIDPDSVDTYDILTCSPVVMNSNHKNVIGSINVTMKNDINDLRIKTINRYSGYYNPIFKDILFYKDYRSYDENYNIFDCLFSNTGFDYEYEDNYGKFGIIDNMWFHKVNDNPNVKVINTSNPYYPLIGQYALDKRRYNIFESNWDANHYTRQVNVDSSESCQNIVSMKDGLCMFGSKYLNVPNTIEICGFSLGDEFNEAYLSNTSNWKDGLNWAGEWNDDWITNPDGCPGEIMFKEVNDNSVDFYFFFKKRILRHFREKLKDEFSKYIGTNSFGKEGIDDDIDEYVSKNVLKLYNLDKIRIFVRRRKKGQHNSKIENEYEKYLQFIPDPKTGELVELTKDNLGYFKSHGFVEINNATMTKINRDNFDRKLVYNLRNGTKEDFGFSFVLKKI